MIIKTVCEKEKPHPQDLLNDEGSNKIYSELEKRKDLKVIDLGCRVPISLMFCYHNFSTSKLLGIDKGQNQRSCIKDYANSLKMNKDPFWEKADKCKSFFDVYKDTFIGGIENARNNELLEPPKFEELLKWDLKIGIEKYLKKQHELFDVIICYNVLHFTKPEEKILTEVKKILKDDGIIFIRVQNKEELYESKTEYKKDFFVEELKSNFDDGYLYEKRKGDNWEGLVFVNREL